MDAIREKREGKVINVLILISKWKTINFSLDVKHYTIIAQNKSETYIKFAIIIIIKDSFVSDQQTPER